MVSIYLFTAKAFTILAYALTVQAAALPTRQDKGPGYVKLPIKKTAVKTNTTILADTPTVVPIKESPDGESYIIELDFGSQGQPISVILDTGSSDLWVADTNSQSDGFDNSKSTTYHDTGNSFSIGYGSGSATGEWVTDTVAIPGGPSLSNFQFADVSQPNPIGNGILGIGYTSNEATGWFQPQYANFPQALKNAGYISKNAYSLYLGSPEAKEGDIIFGGIDNAKYEGKLVTLPVQNPSEGQLDIEFDKVTTPSGAVLSIGGAGVLDSGTTTALFPDDTVNQLGKDLGYPVVDGWITLPSCDTQLSGDLTFTFGSLELAVPLQEFVVVVNDQTKACGVGIGPSSQFGGSTVIGDVILRHAYVYYDLDDNTIGIAPVKYTTDSNIVPV